MTLSVLRRIVFLDGDLRRIRDAMAMGLMRHPCFRTGECVTAATHVFAGLRSTVRWRRSSARSTGIIDGVTDGDAVGAQCWRRRCRPIARLSQYICVMSNRRQAAAVEPERARDLYISARSAMGSVTGSCRDTWNDRRRRRPVPTTTSDQPMPGLPEELFGICGCRGIGGCRAIDGTGIEGEEGLSQRMAALIARVRAVAFMALSIAGAG